MRGAEKWARQQGCRVMTLEVFGQNAAARAVYQRLGYQEQTLKLAKPLWISVGRGLRPERAEPSLVHIRLWPAMADGQDEPLPPAAGVVANVGDETRAPSPPEPWHPR